MAKRRERRWTGGIGSGDGFNRVLLVHKKKVGSAYATCVSDFFSCFPLKNMVIFRIVITRCKT